MPKKATTRLPSVTGVGAAWPVRADAISGHSSSISRVQRIRPVSRSRQSSARRKPPSQAVVRNTRSPQTIGDDVPSPGSCVFQRTFFSALHTAGNPCSRETALPPGPRQRGQSSAWMPAADKTSIAAYAPKKAPRRIAARGNAAARAATAFRRRWAGRRVKRKRWLMVPRSSSTIPVLPNAASGWGS